MPNGYIMLPAFIHFPIESIVKISSEVTVI